MLDKVRLIRILPCVLLDISHRTEKEGDAHLLHSLYPKAYIVSIIDERTRIQHRHECSLSYFLKWISTIFFKRKGYGSKHSIPLSAHLAHLPIPREGVGLVWSHLMLDRCTEPLSILKEWARVLEINGAIFFSCLGPDSFRELYEIYPALGLPALPMPFIDMHDWGDYLLQVGLTSPVVEMETITLTYSDVKQCLKEVRALYPRGFVKRFRGLSGKHYWKKIIHMLEEKCASDGHVSITLEVIYAHAFKSVALNSQVKESVIHFDHKRQ